MAWLDAPAPSGLILRMKFSTRLSYARQSQAKTALTMKVTKAQLLVLLLALTTSCMVGPNYRTPDAKLEQQWTYNSAASGRQMQRDNGSWWKTFKDPVLNNLIEVAYRNNLSQQIAGVRILQARAQLNATIGNLFPQQQNLSGALNYTKVSTPDRLGSFTGVTNDFAMDQVLFSSSWEIDFWGKFRRNIQSEQADLPWHSRLLRRRDGDADRGRGEHLCQHSHCRGADPGGATECRIAEGKPPRRCGAVHQRRNQPTRRAASCYTPGANRSAGSATAKYTEPGEDRTGCIAR